MGIAVANERVLSDHLCDCGCGQHTFVSTITSKKRNIKRGDACRFLLGHGSRASSTWHIEEDRGYVTPCWIWQRSLRKKDGYGQVAINGRRRQAHRFYYERHMGPIPEGKEIDHLCGVKACVNPDHLKAVEQPENLWRAAMRKAGLTVLQTQSLHQWMENNLDPEQIANLWGTDVERG